MQPQQPKSRASGHQKRCSATIEAFRITPQGKSMRRPDTATVMADLMLRSFDKGCRRRRPTYEHFDRVFDVLDPGFVVGP